MREWFCSAPHLALTQAAVNICEYKIVPCSPAKETEAQWILFHLCVCVRECVCARMHATACISQVNLNESGLPFGHQAVF